MSKIFSYFILLIFVTNSFDLSAQNNLEQYAFGFDFVEGIYLTFEEFKNNDPAIKEKNVIPVNPPTDQVKFLDYTKRKIKYRDSVGEVHKLKISNIWGVCNRDNVYIELGNKLHKLVKIGAISYLIELHKGPVRSHRVFGAVGYAMSESKNMTGNLNRIFDFQTGDVVPLTPGNLTNLLSVDTVLFIEYIKLNVKERETLMLRYLDKFNERNPIYFPLDHQKVFNTEHAVEVKFD